MKARIRETVDRNQKGAGMMGTPVFTIEEVADIAAWAEREQIDAMASQRRALAGGWPDTAHMHGQRVRRAWTIRAKCELACPGYRITVTQEDRQ